MAVDYGQGYSSAIADQYKDLRQAIAGKGEAENRRRARDIEQKGLFGSGIKQSDVSDFGNIAIRGAEFGEARMGRKMDRATKSYDRRMKADERRLATLQKRADLGDANALTELKGIQRGMGERRNSFEDFMGKYQEKGLWGTGFGGEDVGYRTEGESKYSQAMRTKKPGGGSDEGPTPATDEFTTSNFGGEREMGIGSNKFNAPEGGPPDRYSSYPHQREFENIEQGTSEAQEEGILDRINLGRISQDFKWGRAGAPSVMAEPLRSKRRLISDQPSQPEGPGLMNLGEVGTKDALNERMKREYLERKGLRESYAPVRHLRGYRL